jgi:hypothetical protein
LFFSFCDFRIQEKSYQIENLEWQQWVHPIWNISLQICNLLFERGYSSMSEMQNSLMRKSMTSHLFDMDLFEIVISKVPKTTTLLKPDDFHKRNAILVLSGDSSTTAHFR